jgi:hypothetical protein
MEENNIYTEAGTYTPANLPSVDVFTPPSIGSVLGPELVNSAKVDAPLQLENVSPQVNAIVSDIRRNTLSTLRNMVVHIKTLIMQEMKLLVVLILIMEK